jgi:hypothetical protein
MLCGTIQRQLRDFQMHFVKQRFGSPGRVVSLAGHMKFPCLPQKTDSGVLTREAQNWSFC